MRCWLLTIVPVLNLLFSSIANGKEWIIFEEPHERWEAYCKFMKYCAKECKKAEDCDDSYSVDECIKRESGPDGINSCNWAPDNHNWKYITRTLTSYDCSQEKSKCKCDRNNYWREIQCKCVNPKEPPSFPATGLIRWVGNVVVDNDDPDMNYHKDTGDYKMFGEVQKNENGWYLKKWTNHYYADRRKTEKIEFEIIIPKDGVTNGFTKYRGDNTTKSCGKYDVHYEGHISSIWEYPKAYEIQSEGHIRGHKVIESWKRFEQGDSDDETWIWTVEYDTYNKVAIPIKFHRRLVDGFLYYTDTENYAYKYHPVIPDEQQFKLEDYCNDL